MKRILIVEDNPEVQIILKRALASDYSIDLAATLKEARELLEKHDIRLIILDIVLPDGDGLRFCAELNESKKSRIPILILSGKTSLEDKAIGFKLGIEDFITKPFDPLELKIRVDARVRKESDSSAQSDLIFLGDVKISLSQHRVEIDYQNDPISLSTKEFRILSYLARNPEIVKTRAEILNAAWGPGVFLADRSVDSHISRLRKRLAASNIEIQSVKNVGYRIGVKLKAKAA